MRIAIDAMGGDHGPAMTVAGALLAAKEWNDVEIILVGDEGKISAHIPDGTKPANITVIHAADVISADDEPARAVRRKKDASMVVAGRLIREGAADAMISAGKPPDPTDG